MSDPMTVYSAIATFLAVTGWIATVQQAKEKRMYKQKYEKAVRRDMNEMERALITGAGAEIASAAMDIFGISSGKKDNREGEGK